MPPSVSATSWKERRPSLSPQAARAVPALAPVLAQAREARAAPARTPSSLASTPRRSLELWGGVECTVNRVGDRYFDQVERTGHASRDSDLDLIAGLGVRTL